MKPRLKSSGAGTRICAGSRQEPLGARGPDKRTPARCGVLGTRLPAILPAAPEGADYHITGPRRRTRTESLINCQRWRSCWGRQSPEPACWLEAGVPSAPWPTASLRLCAHAAALGPPLFSEPKHTAHPSLRGHREDTGFEIRALALRSGSVKPLRPRLNVARKWKRSHCAAVLGVSLPKISSLTAEAKVAESRTPKGELLVSVGRPQALRHLGRNLRKTTQQTPDVRVCAAPRGRGPRDTSAPRETELRQCHRHQVPHRVKRVR